MIQSLAAVSFLVPSYEEGLAFFRDVLGFVALHDVAVGPNKRWVVVAPAGAGEQSWSLPFRATKPNGQGSEIRLAGAWAISL